MEFYAKKVTAETSLKWWLRCQGNKDLFKKFLSSIAFDTWQTMHIAWLLRKWIRGVSFQINCGTASVGLSQENLILWHKLQCYIGISGPRKSRNNTREKNQYTKRKIESYVFSGFSVSISSGWELKSTTGRFATGRFWLFTWKTSSVSKDKVNNWEFCKLKITTIVVFIIMSQRVFSVGANALYDCYSGIVDSYIFIH